MWEYGTYYLIIGIGHLEDKLFEMGDIKVKSMQEMQGLRATDVTFEPVAYKSKHQIKSWADVIIHDILPFLLVGDDSDSKSSSSDDVDNYGNY